MRRRNFLKGAAAFCFSLAAFPARGAELKSETVSSPAMIIDLERCMGCESCVVACGLRHNGAAGVFPTSVDIMEIGRYPDTRIFSFPRLCNQCDDADCIKACPSGAAFRRADGIVVTDAGLCNGCGSCVAACPFGARQADPSQGMKVVKCDFCLDRTGSGRGLPVCVEMCPAHARIFGDINSPSGEFASYLVEKRLFQLSMRKGTGGRVFYAGERRLAEMVEL